MRLIDADALMEVINRHCYPVQHDMTSIEPGMTLMGMLQAIQEQPTIEPQTGKWIIDDHDEYAVCDRCGEPCATYTLGKPRDRFCKWCGADMRGDNDEPL